MGFAVSCAQQSALFQMDVPTTCLKLLMLLETTTYRPLLRRCPGDVGWAASQRAAETLSPATGMNAAGPARLSHDCRENASGGSCCSGEALLSFPHRGSVVSLPTRVRRPPPCQCGAKNSAGIHKRKGLSGKR